MDKQWIVVANASRARFFGRASPDDPLVALPAMEHPGSRMKGAELGDDRPGHEATDNSPGGNRYEPRTDVRRKEHRRFAHEIAERLDEALAAGEFGTLWIFASDPFLGELKAALGEAVQKRVRVSVPSDLTSLDVGALEQRLRELPPHGEPR